MDHLGQRPRIIDEKSLSPEERADRLLRKTRARSAAHGILIGMMIMMLIHLATAWFVFRPAPVETSGHPHGLYAMPGDYPRPLFPYTGEQEWMTSLNP